MKLNVFREIPKGFELVGVFWAEQDNMGFSYSDS